MPDSPNPKMPETALVTRSVEEEARLLEKQRLRTERSELRKRERMGRLDEIVSKALMDAGHHVALKRHMFKTDEELSALKLTRQQIALVRQWEEPKKATAFGIESSAKLIEAQTRAKADKPSVVLNVENMVVLPEKREETTAPVYIDVNPEREK